MVDLISRTTATMMHKAAKCFLLWGLASLTGLPAQPARRLYPFSFCQPAVDLDNEVMLGVAVDVKVLYAHLVIGLG